MKPATPRSYAGESDLPLIFALMEACEAADQLDANFSLGELREQVSHPDFAPDNLMLWADADAPAQLAGYGWLWPERNSAGSIDEVFFDFHVHPDARAGKLHAPIVAWAEEHCRGIARAQAAPLQWTSSANQRDQRRQQIITAHGFAPIRSFFRLVRSLDEPIPEPQIPAGFTLAPFERHDDETLERWVELFNQSFIDHWNYHPMTVEQLRHYLQGERYAPQHDLVVQAPDGTYAAFCYCEIDAENNRRTGRSEGAINILGTRRGYRNRGLARALLLATLHQLKAEAMTSAVLGVDAENPSGALRLYQSLGFHQTRVTIIYAKELS
jgi:mycothiol synthase